MGLMDGGGLLDQAKRAVRGRSGQVAKGIDAATDQIDRRTDGTYGGRPRSRAEDLKARARQLDDEAPPPASSPPRALSRPAGWPDRAAPRS